MFPVTKDGTCNVNYTAIDKKVKPSCEIIDYSNEN